MLHSENPVYIPILLPNDAGALEHLPGPTSLMLSAAYSANPRLEPMLRRARQRAELLLVDPKTAHFQFEGYMSTPDYRALPYGPGRGALGTLWVPARFDRTPARIELTEKVFALQRQLGAGALLAPYFYIPHAKHPWLEICGALAADAIDSSPGLPVGIPLCVDIDALVDPDHLQTIVAAYRSLDAAFFWVTIVNFDERRADPRDAATVVAFIRALQDGGTPVVLSHVGRAGLLAIACGAAGYASGTHGLETHPRAFFRENLGSRPANSYYLYECFLHLSARGAEACLNLEPSRAHPTCGCAACCHEATVTHMVSRRLSLHSMLRRFIEVEELCSVAPADRCQHLVGLFSAALERAPDLSEGIAAAGAQPIQPGEFHYLEVLREAAGGPPATIPIEDDYD